MATLLEQYSKSVEVSKEIWDRCLQKSGKFAIGPTKRGGIFVRWDTKDITNDASLKDVKELRDLLNYFLQVVAEAETVEQQRVTKVVVSDHLKQMLVDWLMDSHAQPTFAILEKNMPLVMLVRKIGE